MSIEPELGRLKAIEPRSIWAHEALGFTPWLLENVDVLSDLLGMDLVLEVAEHPVGTFSLDLKGYDEATGEVVIVENQLEQSDHTHLGQIITYAAGTEPTTVVWIATGFRPEHRAAIDWLNQRTDENTRFFGVVIRVVQIGDSQPAPNFELVAQPNDWEKRVRSKPTPSTTSARAMAYREFWEFVLGKIREIHPEWTRARTSDQSWINNSLGLSGMVIALQWLAGRFVAQIYFDSSDGDLNQLRFDWLYERREAFESALGSTPNWDPMPGRKGARIVVASSFDDVSDSTRWPELVNWVVQQQLGLRRAVEAVGGVSAIRNVKNV